MTRKFREWIDSSFIKSNTWKQKLMPKGPRSMAIWTVINQWIPPLGSWIKGLLRYLDCAMYQKIWVVTTLVNVEYLITRVSQHSNAKGKCSREMKCPGQLAVYRAGGSKQCTHCIKKSRDQSKPRERTHNNIAMVRPNKTS